MLLGAVQLPAVTAAESDPSPLISGASGGYGHAGDECDPAHDTSRDVQKEGVGNPFNYGERNTPADASEEEIRAINHAMTVQEVKYALYKEIDEHWDLISVRLGQPEREKVYALFLGLGSRESTLGGNGDGADLETAQQKGFGVDPAHAYGTLQTAVTAFADCDPTFVKEDNVPEMYQYSFTPQNFYDAIISNHMGIRKILHFVELCINTHGMTGYHVVRNSLKGFNTGWCDMAEDDGAYRTYADEICAMAQFYYYEGHLYDNVFTWTESEDVAPYRTDDRWEQWWGDTEPSMAPIEEAQEKVRGDINGDGEANIADAVLLQKWLLGVPDTELPNWEMADLCEDERLDVYDMILMRELVTEAGKT
ncbi:MAG: dockerin type I repeat-containing protein [Ruminococcus sp.]|nr:dockerin type I repeat-containing protein [Ruminococcus sp.]